MEDILEENTQLITSWMDKMTLKASITQMLTPGTASCSAVFVQGDPSPIDKNNYICTLIPGQRCPVNENVQYIWNSSYIMVNLNVESQLFVVALDVTPQALKSKFG